MEFTARQIAEILDGHIQGNPDVSICKLAKIEQGIKGSLSFLSNPLYAKYIYTTKASIVLVNENFIPQKPISTTLIKVKDSYFSFSKFLEIYNQIKSDKKGISKNAFISENAKVGKDVYIGEFTFIGENVSIGKNVKIYPNSYIGDNVSIDDNTIIFAGVKIYSDNIIGKDCIIHAGVVIGADGFGFAPQTDSKYKKIDQIGNVIIEDNVEIGANTTIDRATLNATIIHKGVKLDNLIQIAHNVEIGENTVIAAQTGISGSTKIGKNCMIGGQVGISGHLTIADNVKIAAQSGIMSNLKKNEKVMGSPAFKSSKYKKSYIHFRKLYDIEKRITELEKNDKRTSQNK